MEVSREQYIAAFNRLPEQVRSYLVDNELEKVVQALGTTYGLHVDVQGTLNKSASYMLMGLQSPTELLGTLVMAGVDAETGKKILADLNEKVFVPLRADMQSAKTVASAPVPATPVPPQESVPVPPVQKEVLPVAVPQSAPPEPAVISTPALTTHEEQHRVRTMATDMQAVKEHRAPEPVLSHPAVPVQTAPQPRIVPPAPTYVPPTPPPSVVMPPPMPPPHTAVPSVVPVASQPEAAPVQKIVPPPENLPQVPQPNQYPVDPYREPID